MTGMLCNDNPVEYVTRDRSRIRELFNASLVPGLGVSLAEAVVEAGAGTEAHYHENCDEFYYGLEGRGVLFIDGVAHPFGKDACFRLPRGSVHSLRAMTRLRLLCVCSPGYSHEGTVLVGERAEGAG